MIEHPDAHSVRSASMPRSGGTDDATAGRSAADEIVSEKLNAEPAAVWATLLRTSRGAPGGETATPAWRVVQADEPRLLLLATDAGPVPDLRVSFHLRSAGTGLTEVAIRSDHATGTLLQRWTRRQAAERLGLALVYDATAALARSTGAIAVRAASRQTQRGLVQLAARGNFWSGDLVDVSATGISMSLPISTSEAELQAIDQGQDMLARVRLARTRIEFPVAVAHVTRRATDILVGLRALDSKSLTTVLPPDPAAPRTRAAGSRFFHLPRRAR